MADSSLTVKDSTGATKTLSVVVDSTNSNYLAPKHAILSKDGDKAWEIDANNAGLVVPVDGTGGAALFPVAAAHADATANKTSTFLASMAHTFNGTTWDRRRGTVSLTNLASAARTALVTGSDFTTYNAFGMIVTLDVTVIPSDNITLTIQGKDNLGVYYTLLAGAAVSTVSTNKYIVFPGSTVTANVSANQLIPRVCRINMAVSSATSITYSVGVELIGI